MTFKQGNLVRLKSGGPLMTVRKVITPSLKPDPETKWAYFEELFAYPDPSVLYQGVYCNWINAKGTLTC